MKKLKARPKLEETVFVGLLVGNSLDQLSQDPALTGDRGKLGPLILAAKRRFAEAAREDRDTVQGWAMLAAREIYRRMLEAGDLAGALAAVKAINDFAERRHKDRAASAEIDV